MPRYSNARGLLSAVVERRVPQEQGYVYRTARALVRGCGEPDDGVESSIWYRALDVCEHW